MANKKPLKEILKENKKYRVLHYLLATLIGLDVLFKIILGLGMANGNVLFVIMLLLVILFFSGLAFIGLLLKKTWGYWVVIFLALETLNSSTQTMASAITNLLIFLPIPIYLLYKISQEQKKELPQDSPVQPPRTQ